MVNENNVANIPSKGEKQLMVVMPVEAWSQIVDYIRDTPAPPKQYEPIMNMLRQVKPQEVTVRSDD